ncbi:5-methyltetrahydropteroyltriglutamate--homocysteine S-methyltransferase [Blochmannia endosymbiont of Colobopsis nipponica]|uniref:5-methyltetrahydropteroyltriglutamate-- homocysteine S-methyltransferase n=1 Tax=Blochmannia endosymbiont of Colobopsis nipponica TaxID=2681987 RepID=UPI0017859C11|nr:5-methyltetrahydropteroyltriglutamate--homocysteine S-methyltransferase [Blochmannia endosymbiont of Colobopsis nipponica]QOI10848.1 5-methyltetrahydropteroyltriglutamate--homocysteine S-methyltransferase [Blochmannia endosymbiont of Colobopsis nipponica]
MTVLSHILGFPRIGLHRELKKSLENYWNGQCNKNDLLKIGRQLRMRHWQQQKDIGIDLIPVGDFAWYDHVLTNSFMVNNIPDRHRNYAGNDNVDIDLLFFVARGGYNNYKESIAASDMIKWFNTNYHYIVPEFVFGQKFELKWIQLLDEVDEALSLGYNVKPVLLGPLTYLWLGKTKGNKFNKLLLLDSLLLVYKEILEKLAKKGISWVQIDEPILVLELPNEWKEIFYHAYFQFKDNIQLLLTTYFDSISHQIDVIREIPVQGIHVDCTIKDNDLSVIHKKLPSNWLLSAGVINGRNIWCSDLYSCFKQLSLLTSNREIWVGSSCSLLHSPIDLSNEVKLNKEIKNQLAFAIQKCKELVMLRTALNEINDTQYQHALQQYSIHKCPRLNPSIIRDELVEVRLENIISTKHHRKHPYEIRKIVQKEYFKLPILPITTIGSFPQTEEIRKMRLDFKSGRLDYYLYCVNIRKYIKKIILEQENIGLDVLVHGEIERNDMVEYFSEHLNGFIFTQNGWIQSYGSRCVKPPIIIGDVSRRDNKEITVKWINYAQSLTNKPVKGMLTGPITIMSWSFCREDINPKIISLQIASAIQDEVMDLENAGINIIQIDEPAFRESLPLKISAWSKYLKWAVESFKVCSSLAKDSTQIHTHMCYSEFSDIIDIIVELDADVITIEASRSNLDILECFKEIKNFNSIGPGIYDVHSSVIPSVEYFTKRLYKIFKYISIERLWVNPDCGLKTRSWREVIHSLTNMVQAVKKMRKNI